MPAESPEVEGEPLQRHPEYTRQRIRQLADRMRGLIYPEKHVVEDLRVAGPVDRISHADAMRLKSWRRARIGDQFGPLWATFWFRAAAKVPQSWSGSRVDLCWISHSEATLWVNGQSRQGLNYDPTSWDRAARADAMLLEKCRGGQPIAFEIEMACNGMFGDPGQRGPYSRDAVSQFVFEACELRRFDPAAWELFHCFSFLVDLETDLSRTNSDPSWAGELLFELNRFANIFDDRDKSTWKAAAAILAPLSRRRNGTTAHNLSAIGHAHIDTAWLWPLAETWRKCERTFSSQTAYMREYPEYKFACSQAYQYDVIKRRNPHLWKRIVAAVKRGQWIPVGGTWIEPDCNIPSGESLVRQFLYGQQFFKANFGRRCSEFWNPDVFGYNGQLPQIMRGAGISRFLTQKLSWNKFTKPPFHTFTWQGIDASEVLAHFPPADTYNASCSVQELRHNVQNYKDHDRSRESFYLFGYGDGGGGPTRQMIEYLRRARDVQGLPRCALRSPDEFFSRLEKDCPDMPVIVGELYFELHRGTYTTQAATKRANRKCERLMHDLECLSAIAWRLDRKSSYPRERIDQLWKTVLLNQFHDILPGSSITLVYEDAKRDHERVERESLELRSRSAAAVFHARPGLAAAETRAINTTSFDRREVVDLPNSKLAVALAPSYGIGKIVDAQDRVRIESTRSGWTLENTHLRATISNRGRITSLIEKSSKRESLAGEANVFELFDDRPTNWEAWDVDPYHLETRRDVGPARSSKVVTQSPLRVEIRFEHPVGRESSLIQTIRLDAHSRRIEIHCEVDWRESHKFLKVAVPVNVRAMCATYEMQFGCVERSTHFNTPGDLARFEVPLHKWMDLSEHRFGVALLSESKYGGSTLGSVMRLSLLRGTRSPDPVADIGTHRFSYAIFPHAGGWREGGVVAEGYKFNAPLLIGAGVAEVRSFAAVDSPDLVIDTIKKAGDEDALVIRLYECHGARGTAALSLGLPFKSARFCNFLEDDGPAAKTRGGKIEISYRPFQIISLKVR